jgi:hypothetical protein
MRKKVSYRVFRATFTSWTSLCDEAANFASTIAPDDLISISHSCDNRDGVVIVWYWG